MNFEEGDIVQITDESHSWFPCLIIVTEQKSWGVQGYMSIPTNDAEPNGNAFIRLKHEQVEKVGKAVFVRSRV